MRNFVGNDEKNLGALSTIVGDKPGVYGLAGVGPGLKPTFTPGNFQGGKFFNDHWGKLLAGGGLLAALMYALRGNNEQQQQQQPSVVNNYMGGWGPPQPAGQPQFSRMQNYEPA